ncbi:ABC transporter permease [Pigmentiphaga soli]|uniref:ABC transporter permease n=1 Tax=Pigmentiphaga soli TaxID=1007095 RepID=A0ABP8GGC9_9BURK
MQPQRSFKLSAAGVRALLLLPVILFLFVFLLIPFGIVLVNSLSSDGRPLTLANYIDIVADEFYWDVMWRTLRISLFTTLAALCLGYPAALYLYFSQSRWRRVFLFVVISPLFISVIVRTYGWIMIFTPSGVLNALLPDGLSVRLLKTETAVVIGMMHIYLPFMVLSLNTTMSKIDKRLLAAASTLGASNARLFRDILFPLSVPGIVAGCSIVFSISMTAFSTPVLLGGTANKTMPFIVYQQNLVLFDSHTGGALAITLLAASLLVLWGFKRLSRGATNRLGV